MSVTSGFFNSVNHDRLYNAEQISSMFDGIILDGIYQGLGDAFIVKPYSDLNCTVTVGTGRAWFDHTWTLNSTELALTLDDPNVLYDRIDAIVIDVDRRQAVRANSIKVVKGTVSETGVTKPALIKEELHNQYPLAYVTVKAGSPAPIQAQYIENMIGKTDTPLVAGVLEHMDIGMFIQQMEDEFNVWFEGLKDVVSGDSITNLQQQINDINGSLIPVKSTLLDIIKNGNTSTTISKFNLSNGGNADTGSRALLESKPNNQTIILPDGKFVRTGTVARGEGSRALGRITDRNSPASVSADISFYVKLYDANGSLTKLERTSAHHSLTFVCEGTNSGWTPWLSEHNPFICNIKADTYPVSFVLVSINYYYDSDDWISYNMGQTAGTVVYSSYVTISSDGVISFSNSTHQNTLVNSGQYPRPNAIVSKSPTIYPAYMDDLTPIFLTALHDYAQAIKVDSTGVISGGTGFSIPNALTGHAVGTSNGIDNSGNCVGNSGYHVKETTTAGFVFESSLGSVSVDTSTLAKLSDSYSAPSTYVFPYYGTFNSLSNNSLKEQSYSNSHNMTTTDKGIFVTPAFSMGLSLVSNASSVFIKDYEDIKEALIFGSNSVYRELYYDEDDRIGAYNILKTTSSGVSIDLAHTARNKYRSRQIGNNLVMVYDNADETAPAVSGEKTVSIVKI